VPARFAAAKLAGATEDEPMETPYYAMRGAARACWSTIKHIEGVEELNRKYKTGYDRETET
jgi:hypothetical protein